MSQEKPRRTDEPVKYGDDFDVSGNLASQPIAPQDAAALQAAENVVLGQVPKGGPAAVMQAAADLNHRRGVVGQDEMTEAVTQQGAAVSEAEVRGYSIITESIAGQVVGQYGEAKELPKVNTSPVVDPDAITIGEALEATALTSGNRPVDESDAAAIWVAEARATGQGHKVPGGIAAEAQSAVVHNLQTDKEEEKTTVEDILMDASLRLANDKPATREDAERVLSAEVKNAPELAMHPGGVAESVAAAAKMNLEK